MDNSAEQNWRDAAAARSVARAVPLVKQPARFWPENPFQALLCWGLGLVNASLWGLLIQQVHAAMRHV